MLRHALEALVGFLYPPACPACRARSAEELLCAACAPAAATARDLVVPEPLARWQVVVACRYAGVVRDLVHELKYGRDPHPSRALGSLLSEAIAGALHPVRVDAIIPIPLSRRRLRQRGFNQAALIASRITETVSAPVIPELLRRPVHRPPQADLGPAERARNVDAVFAPGEGLFGRAVLLVDDVITTGHTMAEAAATLERGGARRVVCAAVAASGWALRP